MRRLIIIALLAASSAIADDEPSRAFVAAGWFGYGASIADFATTEAALRVPGIVELNPYMQDRRWRAVATIAAPVIVNRSTDWLRKKGHPTAALWIRIASGSAFAYVAIRNTRNAFKGWQ